MKNTLQKYGIEYVYHFTDKSNIQLIKDHGGILSLAEMEDRGISPPKPGGNDWSHEVDKRLGYDRYVHLAFSDQHPMLWSLKQEKRIENPVWLMIDSSIILDQGVLFSADVSNKAGVEVFGHADAEIRIDFDILYGDNDWRDPEVKKRFVARKSEILIPDIVPLESIKRWKNG